MIKMLCSSDDNDYILGKGLLENNLELGLLEPEGLVGVLEEIWYKLRDKEKYYEINQIITNNLIKFRYKESD